MGKGDMNSEKVLKGWRLEKREKKRLGVSSAVKKCKLKTSEKRL